MKKMRVTYCNPLNKIKYKKNILLKRIKLVGNGLFTQSSGISFKIIIDYNGDKNNFTKEKTGRHHLN